MIYYPPNRDIALSQLCPNRRYIWTGEDWTGLVFHDNLKKPVEKDVQKLIAALDAEDIKNEYELKRKKEYPSVEDQLDYIYHNGLADWKTNVIEPIKTKYPKPEEKI